MKPMSDEPKRYDVDGMMRRTAEKLERDWARTEARKIATISAMSFILFSWGAVRLNEESGHSWTFIFVTMAACWQLCQMIGYLRKSF